MIQNVLFLAGFAVLLVALAMAARAASQQAGERAQDPQTVLRHCRQDLQLLELELRQYPVTRDLYEVFEGIRSAIATIDQVALKLKAQEKPA